MDQADNWSGGDAILWLMGDLFDRGPDGIACLRLTRKLQEQAKEHGGEVDSLLGNHELMLLAARHFSGRGQTGMGFREAWLAAGGQPRDLMQLTDEEAEWIRRRPAMVLLGDYLLLHADATLYLNYGLKIEQVNQNMADLMLSNNPGKWANAIQMFSQHNSFTEQAADGQHRAEQMLKLYGGRQMIHGHTPIPLGNRQVPETVTRAWVYANGRCCSVDAGLYLGSPGFIHRLNDDLRPGPEGPD